MGEFANGYRNNRPVASDLLVTPKGEAVLSTCAVRELQIWGIVGEMEREVGYCIVVGPLALVRISVKPGTG